MQTIQEVIQRLEEIVAETTAAQNPLAFFATLYLKVTIRVSEGIAAQEFEDNPRMEKLDVIFAQRFLDAYEACRNGQPITQSWRVAFEAAQKPKLILQHLLLGINAHINLDLGIAASQTVGEKPLSSLKTDFDTLNQILGTMVNAVQDKLNRVSPLFFLVDQLGGTKDEALAAFSINIARDGAWAFARQWHSTKPGKQKLLLNQRDQSIAHLAKNLVQPKSKWLNFLINLTRWFEVKKVSEVVVWLKK
jgi:hypothetical protein